MRKVNAANERAKREYLVFLREAKGQGDTTLDKVASALRDFEESVGGKAFTSFHRQWATTFKDYLSRRKNERTGEPLSASTRDATLRLLKGFIEWLPTQSGYKSKITYADAAYFNNNAREARIAHTARPKPFPSLEQCAHAFGKMLDGTDVERRNKAIFAFLMLTGARDSAAATLLLKHVDLVEGLVYQDARDVHTKNGKSFDTWFFPVDAAYRQCFEAWVTSQREERLYGPTDAVLPKMAQVIRDGKFVSGGLAREPYSNGQPINKIIKEAFQAAGMRPFNAHSLRKTLAMLMDKTCTTMEERKAWSQNLGHEHLATTVSAYMPVSRERQGELIKRLAK